MSKRPSKPRQIILYAIEAWTDEGDCHSFWGPQGIEWSQYRTKAEAVKEAGKLKKEWEKTTRWRGFVPVKVTINIEDCS